MSKIELHKRFLKDKDSKYYEILTMMLILPNFY